MTGRGPQRIGNKEVTLQDKTAYVNQGKVEVRGQATEPCHQEGPTGQGEDVGLFLKARGKFQARERGHHVGCCLRELG